jgi:hypothetical protein
VPYIIVGAVEYNEGNRSSGKKEKKTLQTTVTLEFTSDTKQHIRTLEHQLKHIHDVKVDMVVPKDPVAPVLVAIAITKGGARAERAAQSVAQTLHDFLREDTSAQSQKKIFLVTIEGERIDIEPLSAQEIERIILEALEGETA